MAGLKLIILSGKKACNVAICGKLRWSITSQYTLSYGIENLTTWENNVIIYNHFELDPFSTSINPNGYPTLTHLQYRQSIHVTRTILEQ